MSDSHDTKEVPQGHGHDHPKHELSYYAKRIYAIRDLLIEKAVITDKDIQSQVEYQEARSPANGAKLVARAWVDPAFKSRLIGDPKAACAEIGIDATSINEFVVLGNTARCVTWWSALCALAIRDRSWSGRPICTRVSTIVNGR